MPGQLRRLDESPSLICRGPLEPSPPLHQEYNVCPSTGDVFRGILHVFPGIHIWSTARNSENQLTLAIPFRRIHELVFQGIGVSKSQQKA
jgi:hypothetical protein